MDTVVKKLFLIFGIILLAGVLVSAVQINVESLSKRGMHEQYAGARIPILSVDNAAKIFDYYKSDPANADQNIFNSDVGGIFVSALAATPRGDSGVPSSETCYSNADCVAGKKCSYYNSNILNPQIAGRGVQGVCVDSCFSDSGCLDYEACVDSDYPLVVRPAEAGIGGVCVNSCSINDACGAGEECSYFENNLVIRHAGVGRIYTGVCRIIENECDFNSDCEYEFGEGYTCEDGVCAPPESAQPLCGDLNSDGVRDVLDVTFLVSNVYRNGPAPNPAWIGDVDGDGYIDKFDIAALSNHVFKNGAEPSCSGGVHCEGDYCGKTYIAVSNYSCGDITGDSKVTEKDVDELSRYIFNGETIPSNVKTDLNGDGVSDVLDVVSMISYYYRNGPAPSCLPKPTECGDINKDGAIDSNDIQKITDYIFSGETPSNWVLTDMNGDCSYDILDVTSLVSYVKRNGAQPLCGGEKCIEKNLGRVHTASATSCGNIDKDSDIDKIDVDKLKDYVFGGVSIPSNINADLNGDNVADVLDVVALVNYVYRSGSAPTCLEVYVENKAPENLIINGPTQISDFGVSSSWQISASDPEGGNLTYIIYFGDGQSSEYSKMLSGVSKTVSHIYNKPTPDAVGARYKMRFIAKDEFGSQATIEQDINVGITNPGGGGTPAEIVVTKPTAGTYTAGSVMEIKWTAPSTVSTATIYAMAKTISGSWTSTLIAKNIPSSGGGQYNHLLGVGGTNIQVIGYDSASKTYLSDLSDSFTITAANKGFSNGQNITIVDNRNYAGVPADLVGAPVIISSIENINDQTVINRIWHGSKGKIIGGPQYLTIPDSVATKWLNVNTNNWRGWFWKVHFDSGVEGWSDEFYLKPAANVFAFTSNSLVNPVSVYVGDSNKWRVETNVPLAGNPCSGSITYDINWGDSNTSRYVVNCPYSIGYVDAEHIYTRNGTFTITGKATSTMTNWVGTVTRALSVIASYKPIIIDKLEVQGIDTNGMI
ncbi:hypothetical protein HYT23_05015 [Candidatus Pacearchaeota archaeon]|nr:hypothetical protein [Candidatus Pacearchaeota archaeon]